MLSLLLASAAALSFTSCTNTQAGRGYRVNSLGSMSSAPGGWVVERSGGHTNLSYSDLARY